MSKSLLPSMALLAALHAVSALAAEAPLSEVVLGVHGGTGAARSEVSPQAEQALRADLDRALAAGYERLQKGQSSLDAVEAAIRVLEDSPHFNAGRGSVFTHDGRNEMDASIMDGKTSRAGGVGAVTTIKNPISAARAVMDKSKHVLMVGSGAETFAAQAGVEIVDPKYFWTEKRWNELQKQLKEDSERGDKRQSQGFGTSARQHEWGTVGAVALDPDGNLAAGTSTGGRTNKLTGRLGDSPIIGAGTYADNKTCAVSGTGHGEYFMRLLAAYDIAALMKYKALAVDAAAAEVVMGKLKPASGEAGMIALDGKGNFAMSYNTPTMYRGYVTRDGKRKVMIFEP